MSVFLMKLLAVISMLIDHAGYFLRFKFHIGDKLYILMRSLGRFAFPVFCFLIVNGFEKSSDRPRYIARLTAFAAISQIPFSLAVSSANYSYIAMDGFMLKYPPILVIVLLIAVSLCWYMSVRADATALLPAAALLLGVSRFGNSGIYVLYPSMNVFYTLALGLACICFLDNISDGGKIPRRKALLQLMCLLSALLLIRGNADYGYLGLALIILLWLTRSDRKLQILVILLWSAYEYIATLSRPEYFIVAAASVLPVLFYNGKLGHPFKTGFYIFYPAHLLVLGLLAILL